MNFNILFTTLLFFTNIVIGQVSFKTVLKQNTIVKSDILEIDFIANKEIENFIAPNFIDFEIISGPVQEVSRSWHKGKSSFLKKYSYKIRPLKLGKIIISGAKASFESKEYSTEPVNIKVLSLREKIETQMTAHWLNQDKSKLILINDNPSSQFNYRNLKFYLLKNNQVSLVNSEEVLPSILLNDAIKLKELKEIGYDISTAWLLYGDYKFLKLQKPQNNKNLIFEISYNVKTKNDEELNKAIMFLEKYTNKKIVYQYQMGKFILKK